MFTFRRLLDPATGAEYANLYYPILNAEAVARGEAAPSALGVRAIDDRTLEIALERPTPYFLAVVAHQTSAPVNPRNVEKFGRAFARPGNLVSNGAFRLAVFTPNDETVLVKNPYFHAARDVAIDKEIITSIDDRAAAFLRFPAGEIDSYDDAPADELAFVRETLEDEFHAAPTLGILYLAFNTKKPPFDDSRVRCALSMVVDREFLAERIWGGAMAPAYAFVPPGIDRIAAEFRDLSPIEREDRARALLKEAGYGEERPLSIEIRYNTSENNKATAVAIADMWKPLGVAATFVNTDVKTHFGLLQNGGDFDVARAGWIGDYSDPQNFLFLFESGNARLNYARWSNGDFDALMKKAAAETDLRARAKTLVEAERLLLAEEPVIPLLFYEFEKHGVAAGEGLTRQPARPSSGAVAVDRARRGGTRRSRNEAMTRPGSGRPRIFRGQRLSPPDPFVPRIPPFQGVAAAFPAGFRRIGVLLSSARRDGICRTASRWGWSGSFACKRSASHLHFLSFPFPESMFSGTYWQFS